MQNSNFKQKQINWYLYKQYLRSQVWKRISKQIKENADFRCKLCGSSRSLRVHHHTYDNVFKETEKDLICLCNICHYKIHNGCDCIRHKKNPCEACEYVKKTNNKLYMERYEKMIDEYELEESL